MDFVRAQRREVAVVSEVEISVQDSLRISRSRQRLLDTMERPLVNCPASPAENKLSVFRLLKQDAPLLNSLAHFKLSPEERTVLVQWVNTQRNFHVTGATAQGGK